MRMSRVACLLLGVGSIALRGQDTDTIVLKNDYRKFTLVSQIEDAKEADAFLSLVGMAEPGPRYEYAHRFAKNYPQSWLLAQVYDLAARSAIDLDKYGEALEDGRFSLRLLPENSSLLVLLANVEARQNLYDEARRDATAAIEYLDEIERPPGVDQREWNVLKPQLKASAYFARARVEASLEMAPGTSGTADKLRNALADLNYAAAWNEGDEEVFYLRAIVELRLQMETAAASDLAFVLQSDHPLREKSRTILLTLAKRLTLATFLNGLPAREIDPRLRDVRRPTYPEVLAEGYAGSEACRGCHAREYASWDRTGMARMLRPVRAGNVVGDFSPGSVYRQGSDVVPMGVDARPYFELFSSGKWQRFYVDFTIGSKWQQAYATKLPDGRLQVFPIEYSMLRKKWINYWQMIDPVGSTRAALADFPKFLTAVNYQQNCAICHTSQLKFGVDPASSMEQAVYLQPGINCEMCHGPSAWHIRQASKHLLNDPDPLRPPFNFKTANNRDAVRVCAQCHRQSAVREIGQGGEMNYSREGSFVPTTWLRSYDAFSRKAFYKDGRFRETTFIAEAFTRSACYLRGTAQCGSCHSPHTSNFESNQTSLKDSGHLNEMCLQCHAEYRSGVAEHTHHANGSEGSQCVDCHMPRIVNALLFTARSHQIEVPSVDLTERFGQVDSPNVCLTCHPAKSVSWVKEQLATWRH